MNINKNPRIKFSLLLGLAVLVLGGLFWRSHHIDNVIEQSLLFISMILVCGYALSTSITIVFAPPQPSGHFWGRLLFLLTLCITLAGLFYAQVGALQADLTWVPVHVIKHFTLSYTTTALCWGIAITVFLLLWKFKQAKTRTALTLLLGLSILHFSITLNDTIVGSFWHSTALTAISITLILFAFLARTRLCYEQSAQPDASNEQHHNIDDTDDLDFMSDLHAAVLQQSPKGARVILIATFCAFSAFLLWANWAELDEVTRGEGKVIPSQKIQIIQNLEGGILSELLIKEGDIVEPSQILLRIDNVRFSSTLRENKLHVLSLKAKAARLKAEAENIEFMISEEVKKQAPNLVLQEQKLFTSRQKELQTSVEILEQQVNQRQKELSELQSKRRRDRDSLGFVKKELEKSKQLVDIGAVSEVEILRLKRQVSDLSGDIKSIGFGIGRVRSTLTEARKKVSEGTLRFRNEAQIELNEILAQMAQLTESHTALEDRVKRTEVISPVRGTIKQIKVNTVGGIIQPGMDILEIVPLDDTLLIESKIRPSDIAFLSPNQKAIVKFSAYDFAIYGGVEGSVEHISADTIEDEDKKDSFYIVKVRTKQNYLGTAKDPLPIISGMTTTTDILTGKKTVLDYLLKPILRATKNSMTER